MTMNQMKRVDYVTLRPYYLLSELKSKNESALKFFDYFAVLYCDCAHTRIRLIFSVYATSVV